MKTAIVHDFLMQMGGAEKVVEVLHDMFPGAPIYTSAYDPDAMPAYYRAWDIRTSFLQGLPFKRKAHRAALLLYPLAFESLDLSGYDLVISSSSAFAKGVITQPRTLHVCYCHTPMRYAWAARTYLKNERAGGILRTLLMPGLHYLRMWDTLSAGRVDRYIANSSAVAGRIRKFYGRDSDIVHPPVDTERFTPASGNEIGTYYVIAARFIPYKRLDIAIEAFTQLGRPLKVIGDGRQRKALEARAGRNVEFLGRVDDVDLPGIMARAKAYIMPGEEDFGIAPVEANSCGRPVIAYAGGGALDSQVDGLTGILFREQSAAGLHDAILRADRTEFDPNEIREHALKFDTRRFREKIQRSVASGLAAAGMLTPVPNQFIEGAPRP
jgi:glycosyltransferase involved in cell wall biosynthesis